MSGVILLMTSPIDLPVSLRLGTRITLAVLLGALFVAGGVSAAAAEQPAKPFNLPADAAAKALRRFTEQSGIPVLFGTETAAQLRTNAVQGEFTPAEAMALLLANTGLVVTTNEKTGALTVSRDPNAQRAAPVASGSRPHTPGAAEVRAVAGDAAITLSPFEVSTDKDTGYAAQETLSGTRLRTSLREVSASLSVLTPEFLEDLALNSYDAALLYTPSVDTYQGDNESNFNGGTQRFGDGQQVSLRGFVAGPSSSHDFFTALERNDTYNVERLTVARGPNAMLFGLGGSAGTVVSSTKRALFSDRRPTLAFKTDRWGSARTELDANYHVNKGKLAVRLNALHSQKREFRRYEGLIENRATLGVVWKPFERTQVTVNHEEYNTGLNLSPLLPPFDIGTLRWIAAGRPTVNFVSQGLNWNTAGRTFLNPTGNAVPNPNGPGLITRTADFNTGSALSQVTAPTLRYVSGLNLANPVVNYRWASTLAASEFGGVAASTAYSLDIAKLNPWTLFGLPEDANLFSGTWDDPARQNRGRWTTVNIEQRLAPSLYLELAGNTARDFNFTNTDFLHIIRTDVDRYLPNGQLNPGYLQPYSEVNGGGQYRKGLTKLQAWRTTLSYEHDLGKFARWLGRHSVSALYESQRNDSELDNFKLVDRATAGLAGFATDIATGNHQLAQRVYYVNGAIPDPLPGETEMVNALDKVNAQGKAIGATATDSVPLNFALRPFLMATKTRSVTNSTSLAWIGRYFANRLTTSVGLRRDTWKLYGVPASRALYDPEVSNPANLPDRYYYTLASQIPYNSAPTKVSSATNQTLGAVLEVLPMVSLTAARSRNFTPTANANNTNYLGEISPQKTGTTTDSGVRFYGLDNRLSVSVTRFRTVAENETRNAATYGVGARAILARLRDNYKGTGDSHFVTMSDQPYRVETTTGLSSTWNYVADGYEVALTFNPSQHWRVYLSGSANKNVLGTHLPDVGAYLNTPTEYQGLETWAKFVAELRKVVAGQRSSSFDLNPASAAARSQATADATYIESQAARDKQTYDDDQSLTGQTTNRNGEYAANGMVTHVFDGAGWRKGLSVGGNFRWRSASIVGYARNLNSAGRPLGVIDVSRPIRGEDFSTIGLMVAKEFKLAERGRLKVQLNVENLLNKHDARLVAVDVDSAGYYGALDAMVPIRYELQRPRNILLALKYTF